MLRYQRLDKGMFDTEHLKTLALSVRQVPNRPNYPTPIMCVKAAVNVPSCFRENMNRRTSHLH